MALLVYGHVRVLPNVQSAQSNLKKIIYEFAEVSVIS